MQGRKERTALAGEKAECKEREIPTLAPVLGDTGTRPVLKPSPREYLSPCWCPLEPVGECKCRYRAARSRASSLLCPTATQTYLSLFRCSWLGHLTLAAIPSSSRSKVAKLACQLYYYRGLLRGTPQRYRNWCAHRQAWQVHALSRECVETPGVWALKGHVAGWACPELGPGSEHAYLQQQLFTQAFLPSTGGQSPSTERTQAVGMVSRLSGTACSQPSSI